MTNPNTTPTATDGAPTHTDGTPTHTPPTLKLENLTAGYGPATVLWDINLEVPPSTVVALLGPNGAGKTTLLRAASGLGTITKGTVTMDGHNVTGRRMDHMARNGLCHIPEGRGVFPSLTVKENLTLFSPPKKEKQSIQAAATAFPILGQRLNQTAGSLSGGEQQMLALVRSYISNPKLVLVDEASMGLAPVIVDQLFQFLHHISTQGTSLLIVEQYVYRALNLASRIYLLNHGRIVYNGTPQELENQDIFERYLGVETGITT
jgi:branched-chain amino acid transport system ATP-binding protein